ncbi:LysR family transcriptional regulator [Xylophilus sp. GW821-FHT01B05]
MTFKQLEALYWVVQLGGFSQAAQKLHTSISAVSKRVQELETSFDLQLFDRTQRTARLTEKGEEMFVLARKLLEQRDLAIDQIGKPEVIERRVRIGVTEFTAMTWLHRLVEAIQRYYPKVTIEPDVDASGSLKDKLLADELDMVLVPDVFSEVHLPSQVIGEFSNVWMCKPGFVEAGKVFRLHELATRRLLLQGSKSGAGTAHNSWMKALGVQPSNVIIVNNLVAMMGLTASGLGIGCMPEKCLAPMVANGSLMVVPSTPAPPPMKYVAMYKGEQRSTLISSIVMLAQECCDFTRMFDVSSAEPGKADAPLL